MASLPARLAFLVSVCARSSVDTAILRMSSGERCAAGNSGSAANHGTFAFGVCQSHRRLGVGAVLVTRPRRHSLWDQTTRSKRRRVLTA